VLAALVEQLTPEEADRFLYAPELLEAWLERHGLDWSMAAVKVVGDRARSFVPTRRPDHPRRRDSQALRELVEHAGRLPRRVRQVAC